jgi:hypothetical protein
MSRTFRKRVGLGLDNSRGGKERGSGIGRESRGVGHFMGRSRPISRCSAQRSIVEFKTRRAAISTHRCHRVRRTCTRIPVRYHPHSNHVHNKSSTARRRVSARPSLPRSLGRTRSRSFRYKKSGEFDRLRREMLSDFQKSVSLHRLFPVRRVTEGLARDV